MPRRRMNRNFHATLDEPCQRLLNAIEPESYVRPHRHLLQAKAELFIAVRGRMAIFQFDDRGGTLRSIVIAPAGPICAVEVPAGEWHTIVALEAGAIFFEVKAGPYRPVDPEDFAPWAPAEGTLEASVYLAQLIARGDLATRPPSIAEG